MLKATNLYKTYKSEKVDYEVLKNINLQINQGECVAIIGKSGSGKSTLMHLLACLDNPTSGNISFEDKDLSSLDEKQKDALRNQKFGFVFQQFFLNGRDTVFENVVLPMRIRGANERELTKDALEALAAVGLSEMEKKQSKNLSGGEKQRVCIARALVGKPQVIFADEPTGNLDSATSELIEKMLFQMNKEKGITLIVVTHDKELAAKCERIIELKDGEIVGENIEI